MNEIIDRLGIALNELEAAINQARKTIVKHNRKEELVRLDSYADIMNKQRTLKDELSLDIQNGNLDEVTRKVALINGLSAMIREDARDLVSNLR